jgi:hypothetical protein
MDVLQKLTQMPDLSRTQVTNAAPDFSRASVQEYKAIDSTEDNDVEALSESEQAPEASEAVIDVQAGGEFDVMVDAVEPDVVAMEATQGETVTVTPVAPEIATQAPEKAVAPVLTEMQALQASLAVHEEAMLDADRVKEAADKAMKISSDKVNEICSKIDALTVANPHAATAGIRDYIAMQNKLRYNRAMRASKFMGNSGAKPSDVAKMLEVRSPIDKAFLGRKPPRGTQRPQHRG